MAEETITWELLKQLGLSITPHSDPAHGWGYTWQNRDWVGPFTTPSAALHAAFTEALLALQFRSASPFLQKPGELWRFDGPEKGWFRIGGPGTEDDEEAAVLASAHVSLTAINGRQKRHILADKQEHSRSIAAVLKQHNLAESAKIGHNLAESTKFDNGFDWPLMHSKPFAAEKTFSQEQDLSTKTRFKKQPERDILAEAANLRRE